jgi:uncharacterized SAM-binding protein YcdF (DUF218 family)
MSHLTLSSIEAITDFMFVQDSVKNADATIVLGMTLWQRPFTKALELHAAGVAGVLVFSGGMNLKLGKIEAVEMANQWNQLGHASTDVLIDSRSVHTRENMIHSKMLLEEAGLYKDNMRINLIAISYHMRRALETFRAVFGHRVELGVVNYQSQYCHPEHWFSNSVGKRLILTELLKINRYLPEVNLPVDITSLRYDSQNILNWNRI